MPKTWKVRGYGGGDDEGATYFETPDKDKAIAKRDKLQRHDPFHVFHVEAGELELKDYMFELIVVPVIFLLILAFVSALMR